MLIDRKTLIKIRKYKSIYLMFVPIAIYFIVFSYYPLILGIISSFRESILIGTPKFVGVENYKNVLSNPLYSEAFMNTIIVNFFTFIVQFIFSLFIALSLNEVKNKMIRSSIQTVTYIPNLLSWAIVGGMWIRILSPTGMLNNILKLIYGNDFNPIVFMAEPRFARTIMVLTGAWKGAGYFAVLLLTAIVSIDQSIYESASIDGASRFKQILYITVPNIVPTMKIITVLGSMNFLRNFDQIFIMGNANIFSKVRNLLCLIYTDGVVNFKIGIATAAATMVLITTFIISTIVRRLTKYDETFN
ncbi:putative aldouronate transport system permease protein [Caldicoprobacter guelmensis]|uniref:ABC transporter permease subunit n=1 Tax=Caldicoprobacter guelmensis TaxID=1170224 RepID=UPI00195BB2BE|nr:ABC transporter permease subunit [Caldicoprobacter guelmensis]MBM7582221.1 putative aldouronate transport system permease protein [Caldicoprobacter guelmensis]